MDFFETNHVSNQLVLAGSEIRHVYGSDGPSRSYRSLEEIGDEESADSPTALGLEC
jgi:hypothetical protein